MMHRKVRRKAITLRGVDPEIAAKIADTAAEEGISINKAALRILRKGAGVGQANASTIGDSLDHLIGTWSEAKALRILESIRSCDQVDAGFWD